MERVGVGMELLIAFSGVLEHRLEYVWRKLMVLKSSGVLADASHSQYLHAMLVIVAGK